MKKLITTASLLALMAAGPAFAQSAAPGADPAKPSMGDTQNKPATPDSAMPGSSNGAAGMEDKAPGASAQSPSTEPMSKSTADAGATTIGQGELRVSKLIGSSVRNGANESIGNVNDVLLTKDGQVESVIVGVGGFLGLGEKNVALQMSELKIDNTDPNKPMITAAATSDALAAAPEWKPPQKPGASSGTSQ